MASLSEPSNRKTMPEAPLPHSADEESLAPFFEAKHLEQKLSKLTGRDWIAIGRIADSLIVLMEKYPVAIMDYSYYRPEPEFDWEPDKRSFPYLLPYPLWGWSHSMVRSYLNGPYFDSFPREITERIVPIKAEDRESSAVDKVTILSDEEILLLIEGAPKDSEAVAKAEAISSSLLKYISEYDFEGYPDDDYDDGYYDEPESRWDSDPLRLWEEDVRQYSKELYDEWEDDYEKAVEAHNYWLSMEEDSGPSQTDIEEERADKRWRASISDYCGVTWTRNRGLDDPCPRYGFLETAFGVRPVICLSADNDTSKTLNPICLTDAERILPMLNHRQLDVVAALQSGDIDELIGAILRSAEDSAEHAGAPQNYDEDLPF